MPDGGKRNLLGVLVDAVDYETAVYNIITAAKQGKSLGVTALAVHGVMSGVINSVHRHRLNRLDLVVPDGQPVRWALNLLYRSGLEDRVYGPRLTIEVCSAATRERLPVYFYGSRQEVLERLVANLKSRFPQLVAAGVEPSKFRTTTEREKEDIVARIRSSRAKITFVGLGCPRQEVFIYEYREALSMPVVAVGAAFDYHAGLLTEPPPLVQRMGLQWADRLLREPRRLWKRYILLGPAFVALLVAQALGLWKPDPWNTQPPSTEVRYG